MQRVIGLDIGSYSIKAVEIVNTFKSYEITNFYENVVPHLDNVPMDAVAPSCMEQLFKENNLEADRIVTAMPGQFISSRLLSLGFSDPRKVEMAVFSEVEDSVPFDMDDMILDHQVLGVINNQTIALAVMTRKAFLKNFLDLLQRINIDPKLVDIDSLAFYNLSSFMKVNPGECFAMVDIGHEKTSVCIIRDGVLRLFRSINLGGRYITEFLARDLETTFQEAQRIKHSVSRVFCADDQAPDKSGDDRMVIERTTLAANAIIKELGRTIYAFKSWESQPLGQIYISGGTSKTMNLDRLIQDQLEVPTSHCRLNETQLKISSTLDEHMDIMPQSVAIGMRTVSSLKKHSQINLRRGEFAYTQNYEVIIKGAMKAFRFVAAAMALLICSYGLKYYIYKKHIDTLQEQYKREYLAVFKDETAKLSKPMTFAQLRLDSSKRVKREVTNMRTAIDAFVAENSGSGALKLLRDMSDKLPKDIKLDVTRYEFKGGEGGVGKVILRAETEGYASQSALVDAIKKVPTLDSVEEKSDAKPGTNGKVIETTVKANYEPIDSKAKKG